MGGSIESEVASLCALVPEATSGGAEMVKTRAAGSSTGISSLRVAPSTKSVVVHSG